MPLRFDVEGGRFNVRVAGIAVREDHVLVHRGTDEDFWTFPGGRLEFGEESSQALVREMGEELGVPVDVGQLFFTVENFFPYAGRFYHELSYYYAMSLPETFPFSDREIVHRCRDEGTELEFRWLPTPLAALEGARLQPAFLRQRLQRLPRATEHIVWRA